MTVIQSYNKYFSGGLGDFIRGSIFIYRNIPCKRKLFIDFKHHPLSNFIINKNESDYDYKESEILNLDLRFGTVEIENKLKKIFEDSTNEKHFISSFYFDKFNKNIDQNLYKKIQKLQVAERERSFFKNCFHFQQNIEDSFNFFLEENKIKKYELVHFRLGDIELLKNEPQHIKNKILNKKIHKYEIIYTKLSNIRKKTVILSDSNDFKSFLRSKKNKNIIVPKTKSGHSVYRPGVLVKQNDNIYISNMFDLAMDLKILTCSKKTTSYSSHYWGSGFSFWISKIFNIKINTNYLK